MLRDPSSSIIVKQVKQVLISFTCLAQNVNVEYGFVAEWSFFFHSTDSNPVWSVLTIRQNGFKLQDSISPLWLIRVNQLVSDDSLIPVL